MMAVFGLTSSHLWAFHTRSRPPVHFGGNFGAGLLFNLTSRVGLEGSYNFHAVNTPVAATKFSTLQGGIRFVF